MTIRQPKTLAVKECSEALVRIEDSQSEELIRAILEADQIFFVGVGRVLLSLQSICKRFAHLGLKAHYVGEITEPAITEKDLLIAGSGSGESIFPVEIVKKAKKIGAKIAWIGSNKESTIACLADYIVRIPVQTKLALKDELKSEQPMTSLFEQSLLLYGDALARVIIDRKQLDMDKLWKFHANLE